MRVSMTDVAKAAKVSQSAVSRVLSGNGYVSEDKRRRVLEVIKELGYRPNALARSLASNKSGTIGLCLPYLNTPFISSLMEGVEEEAEKHGYDVFMCHTKEDAKKEAHAVARMIERQVEGMLVVPVVGSHQTLRDVVETVPIIFMLRKPAGLNRNIIRAEEYNAAQKSFSFLLDNGHRRIGILRGPMNVSTIRERWRGLKELYKRRGLKLDESLVVPADFDYEASHDAAKALLAAHPDLTALYPMHYWASAAVQRVIYENGLRLPEDISVVSYEAFEDWSSMTHLKIAANISPARKMGGLAVARLVGLVRDKELFLGENIAVEQEFQAHESVKKLA